MIKEPYKGILVLSLIRAPILRCQGWSGRPSSPCLSRSSFKGVLGFGSAYEPKPCSKPYTVTGHGLYNCANQPYMRPWAALREGKNLLKRVRALMLAARSQEVAPVAPAKGGFRGFGGVRNRNSVTQY